MYLLQKIHLKSGASAIFFDCCKIGLTNTKHSPSHFYQWLRLVRSGSQIHQNCVGWYVRNYGLRMQFDVLRCVICRDSSMNSSYMSATMLSILNPACSKIYSISTDGNPSCTDKVSLAALTKSFSLFERLFYPFSQLFPSIDCCFSQAWSVFAIVYLFFVGHQFFPRLWDISLSISFPSGRFQL